MSVFAYHQLNEDKNNNGFTLTLYLDPSLTEFSKELDSMDDREKESTLGNEVENYIKKNLKNVKINTVKIMIGSILIATFSLVSPVIDVSAASTSKSLASQAAIQRDKIIINGQQFNFSQAPLVINGTTYISIDDVSRAFGAQVWWNDQSQTVGINRGNAKIAFVLGSSIARVNGKQVEMKSSFVYNGKTMVPLRFVAESLGLTVKWDQATKTTTISSSNAAAPAVSIYTVG